MKLFLVRHGESENNFHKRYSGQCDTPLTDLGREQARAVRPILGGIDFDAVYSSDLCRARETCNIALPSVTPLLTTKIREIALGSYENLPYYNENDDREEVREYLKNRELFNFASYGGENTSDVKKRISEFLKELENKSYENVAAFCHAGFMTIVLSYVLGADVDRFSVICPNCSVCVLDYDGEKWRLACWNYGAKMGESSE